MASEEHQPVIDYTNRDYDALRAAMLDVAAEFLPEWTDHSPSDLGTLLVELFAYLGDVILHYQDRIAAESYPDTAVEPASIISLLRLVGYERTPPHPASADLTLLFTDGPAPPTVTLPTGMIFRTADNPQLTFVYTRAALNIDLGGLPLWPYQGKTYRRFKPASAEPYDPQAPKGWVLPVEQVSEQQGNQWSSDGSAWQRFQLAAQPLTESSLEVTIDEGAGSRAWERRETLLTSGPQDPHFTVRRDETGAAWVEFGDGRTGRVPRGSATVRASYRTCGGSAGNVPAGSITKWDGSIPRLEMVFNEDPATGGSDAEPLDAAARRAQGQFRSAGRAVTARDYEDLARSFGVAKAHAQATAWNRVDLVVAPAGGGSPTDTMIEDLRRWFTDKRPLNIEVVPRGPRPVRVWVEALWDVAPYWFAAEVQQQVQDAVSDLLSFEQVSFGCPLYVSMVYDAIDKVEGVRFVTVTRFARDYSEDLPRDGRLEFDPDEIPCAGHPNGIKLTRQPEADHAR